MFSSSTPVGCLVQHLMLESTVLRSMLKVDLDKSSCMSKQMVPGSWQERILVICVQLCQTASVQTQKENFCEVV